MGNVLKLMKKEIRFILKSMRMQLVILGVFIIILPLFSPSLALMGCVVMPYFTIYGTMAYEERCKGDMLVATLPVSRKQICLSKYLLGILYTLVGVGLSLLFSLIGEMILPYSAIREALLADAGQMGMIMLMIALFYIALMLPLILKFGTEKTRFIMLFLYILMFTFVNSAGMNMGTEIIACFSKIHFLICCTVTSYGISLWGSMKILNGKEY